MIEKPVYFKDACAQLGGLHPSFLKLLCDQNNVEYSSIPSCDGRKNDVLVISPDNIDRIRIVLAQGEKKDIDMTKESKKEKTYLSKEEVSEIIGKSTATVTALARNGVLQYKINPGRGRFGGSYLYSEDSVMKYMEEQETKKKEDKPVTVKNDISDEKTKKLLEGNKSLAKRNQELNEEVNSLKKASKASDEEIKKLRNEIESYKSQIKNLKKSTEPKEEKVSTDISENSYAQKYDRCRKEIADFRIYRNGYNECRKEIMNYILDMEVK